MFVPANADIDRLRERLSRASGDVAGQLGDFDGPLYLVIDPLTTKITDLVNLQLAVAATEYENARTRYHTVFGLSLGLLGVGVLPGLVSSGVLVRRITRALQHAADNLQAGADQTSSAAEQVAMRLQSVLTSVVQVDTLVSEIAKANREQSDDLGQLNTAVGALDNVTQGTAASAEESAAAAEELNAQAESGVVVCRPGQSASRSASRNVRPSWAIVFRTPTAWSS